MAFVWQALELALVESDRKWLVAANLDRAERGLGPVAEGLSIQTQHPFNQPEGPSLKTTDSIDEGF
jgi:hypothetical protein